MAECSEKEKKLAWEYNIDIIESQMPDADKWWISPPENFITDIIIGHGVKLGKQAEDLRKAFKCKWVQVVHTEPEELSSVKEYEGAGAKGEGKSKEEVRLCRIADMVVGIGPKLTDAYKAKLRPKHTVFELTPGIFKEFTDITQAPNEGDNFRVLIFGRGDLEDVSLKGYDLAAQSVAQLHQSDTSVYLIFMGVQHNEHDHVREKLQKHGVLNTRLKIRAFCESRDELAETFQEADLTIMPSRSEGFGLTALEALSAGLPILVGWNTGFAEALKKLPNGNHFVVDSDNANDWAKAIKKVRCKERKIRLEESKRLRKDYEEAYPWPKQCEDLVKKMLELDKHGMLKYFVYTGLSKRFEVT